MGRRKGKVASGDADEDAEVDDEEAVEQVGVKRTAWYSSNDDPLGEWDILDGAEEFVFDEHNEKHMEMLFGLVMDCSIILPMPPRKEKGLAKLLSPEPIHEYRGFKGLTPAHFEPFDPKYRFGHHRSSHLDPLLSNIEANAAVFESRPKQL